MLSRFHAGTAFIILVLRALHMAADRTARKPPPQRDPPEAACCTFILPGLKRKVSMDGESSCRVRGGGGFMAEWGEGALVFE